MSAATKKKPKPTAAEQWAERRRVDDQQRCDSVVAEFDGDSRLMAAEILRLRHGVGQIADAIEWLKAGRPFVTLGPPERSERRESDDVEQQLA